MRHKRLHTPVTKVKWIGLGSDYGGWPIAFADLPPRPVIYSFGIGEDITFDLAAIAQFDATVHAFDPTPRSLKWLQHQQLPANFHIHPIGIAAQDGQVEFFPPANDAHVSFSNAPSDEQDAAPIVAEVRSLDTLIDEIGGTPPTIVKMDVEGFEYDIIAALAKAKARPEQLLIEFHHGMYAATDADTRAAVDTLEKLGYRIFFVSDTGREYGFIRAS